jgi:RHH-type proline utilization regulon transcriptional repressor/proline dehydrogenase/delta 1-pyrroline-5-carboxylate dehydrogenase
MSDVTAAVGETELRRAIDRLHRAGEPEVLRPLLDRAAIDAGSRDRVESRALGLLAELRAAQARGWVNQFLQEYRLNTSEGVALLSLAEAFLRVPDPETADDLIADKLGDGDWSVHRGKSNSRLVNTATWGLVIGRALVGESEQASALKRLISRAGEPFVRQGVGAAMRMMGEIFVMGRDIDEAIKRMRKPENRGFTASFDMLGEAARTFPDAQRYFAAYEQAIRAVGAVADQGHSISVKLSALHPRYEVAQYESSTASLVGQLEALATLACKLGIGLTVDAEESERLEMSLDIIEAVAGLPSLKNWDGLGMAIQAYSKRARPVVAWADDLGRRTGRRIAARLVKGAYWDSEVKRTQEAGLSDYPLFTRKAATDVSYLACARDMLDARHIYPAFATHNALTVANILEWAGHDRDFEFQRLHGMGEGLYEQLVREQGFKTRIYAPVGGHRDLLAYLVRRLLENGANSSFVHQLADEKLTDRDLLADPVAKIAAVGGTRHPSIPLPEDLFMPERKNSSGWTCRTRTSWRGWQGRFRCRLLRAKSRSPVSRLRSTRTELLAAPLPPSPPGPRAALRIAPRAWTGWLICWSGTATSSCGSACRRLSRPSPMRSRGARGGGFLPLLCGAGAGEAAADGAAGADRRAQCAALRRARRVGVRGAVEFPAGHLPRPGDGGARRRQHSSGQARAADAAYCRAGGGARL